MRRVEALPGVLTFYGERNAAGVRELLDSRVSEVRHTASTDWPASTARGSRAPR